jgi:integral membrane sensor domain MASE1
VQVRHEHQFRLALCGHKAVEAAAVCVVLMVQGDLGAITLAHLAVATKTGLLATVPALMVTFTRHARHFANKWTSSAFLGICTFLADALIHPSHYPGKYTEAALTGIGAFVFSLAVSYTPAGRAIDHMAETFLSKGPGRGRQHTSLSDVAR